MASRVCSRFAATVDIVSALSATACRTRQSTVPSRSLSHDAAHARRQFGPFPVAARSSSTHNTRTPVMDGCTACIYTSQLHLSYYLNLPMFTTLFLAFPTNFNSPIKFTNLSANATHNVCSHSQSTLYFLLFLNYKIINILYNVCVIIHNLSLSHQSLNYARHCG